VKSANKGNDGIQEVFESGGEAMSRRSGQKLAVRERERAVLKRGKRKKKNSKK
jgi:hypothetical protein